MLSVTVFASVGALATSGIRFSLAAIILLAVARPSARPFWALLGFGG